MLEKVTKECSVRFLDVDSVRTKILLFDYYCKMETNYEALLNGAME